METARFNARLLFVFLFVGLRFLPIFGQEILLDFPFSDNSDPTTNLLNGTFQEIGTSAIWYSTGCTPNNVYNGACGSDTETAVYANEWDADDVFRFTFNTMVGYKDFKWSFCERTSNSGAGLFGTVTTRASYDNGANWYYFNGGWNMPGAPGPWTPLASFNRAWQQFPADFENQPNVMFDILKVNTASSSSYSLAVDNFRIFGTQCTHPDKAALKSLYESTDGPNWGITWDTSNCDVCSWYGITCVGNRVQEVTLVGNNLANTLPANLNLPMLTVLTLADNNLTGAIPNFTSLPNLLSLDLSGNGLMGTIPNFSSVSNMSFLNLNNNDLTGVIPNFSNLPNLGVIDLSGNNYGPPTTIPSFSNCPNLNTLKLCCNTPGIIGSIPAFNLPNLTWLTLNGNTLTGCIPAALQAMCPNITTGDISNNPCLATQSWTNYCNNQEGMCGNWSNTVSLSGSTTICNGGNADITFNFASGIAPYDVMWTGGTLNGILNGYIESVSPSATTSYTISSAQDANGCTINPAGSVTITVIDTLSLGAITGSNAVCENTSTSYSVTTVSGMLSYDWIVPLGATITGGQGSTSINVDWNGAVSGDVCVVGTNTCGPNAGRCRYVTVTPIVIPPDPITGDQAVCTGITLPYSIPPVNGAATYNWTVPIGAVIQSGQGSTDVTIQWNSASTGNVCVRAQNSCGNSAYTCLSVTASTPPVIPVFISGNFTPCESSTNSTYSVSNQASVNDYQWTVPVGATIVSGQGSPTIIVNWLGAQSGDLCVEAISTVCNTTMSNCQPVTVIPILLPPDPITGEQAVCTGIPLPYSIPAVAGASTYNWTVPLGAVIQSGQGSPNVTIRWNSASTGDVCVRAQNSCGNSTYTCLAVSAVAAPVAPVFLVGANYLPCENTILNYGVTPQAAYDQYDWIFDNGGTITAGQGTPAVTIDWQGAGDGQLCVTASSAVCNVTHTTCKSVIVKLLPPAPEYISYDDVLCVGDTGVYVLQPIAGVSSYNWTASGGIFVGSSTGSTVKIRWPFEVFTIMEVSATNSCGTGPSIAEPTVVVGVSPSQPGVVSGPAAVCQGSTQVYSITPVAGAGSYVWTAPAGAAIVGGQGTVNVSVMFNSIGIGSVCVRAKTGTCTSPASCRSVTVSAGGNVPGAVSGPTQVCQSSVVNYSIAPVSGATSYSWTLPPGATFVGGNNGVSVTVNFAAASSGQLCVSALSNCGASTSKLPGHNGDRLRSARRLAVQPRSALEKARPWTSGRVMLPICGRVCSPRRAST
jgi:hypothetical protein